jgi:glycosyltransferase involved in cell wall biosynthesis
LPATAVSICYCHNPTRFLWQTEGYLNGEVHSMPIRWMARLMFPWMRLADRQAAQRMDIFVANSKSVRERIQRFYGRDARVLHPPVEISRFQVSEVSQDYHLIVSRLINYKRIDRAVEAFNRMGRPLVIVGEGPDRARLESLAGPHVRFMGRLSDLEVQELLAGCRGLVFPGEEDFGIAPVEAQACGKPVIAWRRGGALETVRAGETGVFFDEGTPEALAEAVKQAESIAWNPQIIRRWAEDFSEDRFLKAMDGILAEARAEHQARLKREMSNRASIWDISAASGAKFCPHSEDPAEVAPLDR